VTRRRFLLTAWPWLSLGYLLTTAPVTVVAALALLLLGMPWIALLDQAAGGVDSRSLGGPVALIVLGAVLIAAFGPLLALPLAQLERSRLRLIDHRLIASGHRPPPSVGLWSWLRTRYTEPATWRALGYVVLLATAAPVLSLVAVTAALLVGVFVASPLVVRAGLGPVALGFTQVTTVGQALPFAFIGLVLLPAIPYVLAIVAGAQGAVARALLHGSDSEELRARLVDVSRSRARLADAFEAERRRIERDLHDGAQRRLVSLTLQLGLARLDVPSDSPAAEAVANAHAQAKQVMAELRELIRGIHPRVLTDRGLPAALRELGDDASVPVTIDASVPGRLPNHVEATAYFVVAEALTNVDKHSGATAASVAAHVQRDTLVVEVSDNGHGGADPQGGTGLVGLADRVAVVDGRMLLSSPAGGPTLLRVELPCTE
jgi:signal transduction histidine kinase